MIKIETVYDLLEFSKEHPDYQYTCYDGEWLIYPDDSGSYLKDIEINYKMMRVLEDWDKVLDFECYTISHRAVRNFKIDYEYAKKKIEEIKTFLETAIVTVKDKKYSSLKQIEDALSINKYKVSHDKTTIRNSYWGGGWETQAFDVFNYEYDYGHKNHYLMRIPYYMKQNVIGKKMFKFLLWDYASVFNGWSESSRNYRIPQESGGYIISDEYYKKEKEALDKAYNDIISNKMTTTCDICGKEIIGIENFINAGDKVACSEDCKQKAYFNDYVEHCEIGLSVDEIMIIKDERNL